MQQRRHWRLGEVELDELDVPLLGALLQVAFLRGAWIVVDEAIDADDRTPASVERLDQVRADEAGATRDEIRAPWLDRAMARARVRLAQTQAGGPAVRSRRSRRSYPS
jgi:hypothetical protein